MKFKKLFFVFFILSGLLITAMLELGKNTLLGWGLALVAFVLFLILHGKALSRRRFWIRLLSWAAFFVVIGCVFRLSQPPERIIPAVEEKNPAVTQTVAVTQGKLTGVYTADSAVEVYAGIPYAAPPVGDLRWKAPQDPASWEGVRACDHFAPMSMQQRGNQIFETRSAAFPSRRKTITSAP